MLDNFAEYVSINPDSVVMIDEHVDDWPPMDARNRNGSRNVKRYKRYMGMIFKVISRKPYFKNRRIIVEGRFLTNRKSDLWDDFYPDVYVTKRVQVWHEDTKLMFQPVKAKGLRSKKPKKPTDFVV